MAIIVLFGAKIYGVYIYIVEIECVEYKNAPLCICPGERNEAIKNYEGVSKFKISDRL